MSARKRLAIYGLTLAVLVTLYVVGLLTSPSRKRARDEPLMSGFHLELVTSVEATGPFHDISLVLDDENWLILQDGVRYPARDDRIDILIEELGEAYLVRLVSRDAERHGEFGVGSEGTAISLGTARGEGSFSLVWGNASSEPGLTYVRRGDEAAVYTTDGKISFYLSQPPVYWSYLRVFPESLTTPGVASLRVTRTTADGDGLEREVRYEMERESEDTTAWYLRPSGEKLDSVKVTRFLRDVVDLVGSDFVVQSRDVDVGGVPAVWLEIDTSSGQTFAVGVYLDGTEFVAVPSGPSLPGEPFGGLRYLIDKSVIERIAPEPESLLVE